MTLKKIQQEFIRNLTTTTQPDKFLSSLKPCGNLLPDQQLAIYQNNVCGALQKTLAQAYPICCKILGENYFKQIARGYIADYPSKYHDLNFYGKYFSAFIQTLSEQRSELYDFPYLGDLGQLEWLYHQAHYATRAPVFDYAAFAQLTEEQYARITFQLAPDVGFMSSDFPVASIWKLNQAQSVNELTISAEPECYCIFRNYYKVEICKIKFEEFGLLNAVANSANLETISGIDNSNRLTNFINSGWICGFKIDHV